MSQLTSILQPSAMSTSRFAHVRQILLQTLAWILLVVLVTVLTPLLLFLTLYRAIADRLVSMSTVYGYGYEYDSPILGLDTGFANDDFYGSPKGAIGFVSVFDGPLDPARVEASVTKLLTTNASSHPNLKLNYARLSSLFPSTTVFGYSYWKRAPVQFNAKNHVRAHTNSMSMELNAIISKWIESPFKEGCPLWDILLIPCMPAPYQCVLAVRTHHLIGDGYSLREFMENLFAAEQGVGAITEVDKVKGPHASSRPLHARRPATNSCHLYWTAPSTFFKFVHDFFIYRDRVTTQPKLCQTDQIYVTTFCTLADLKLLRVAVQDLLRVQDAKINFSFSSLILHIFGRALARFWIQRGRERERGGAGAGSLAVPSHVKVASSLPIEGELHPPGVICNHWSHAIFEMPTPCPGWNRNGSSVTVEDDPLVILRALAQNHRSVLQSGLPRLHGAIARHHHILPNPVWRAMARARIGTAIGFVNLPGPETGTVMEFCGAKLVQVTPIAGRQWQNAGMTIAAYSYNGALSLGVLACRDLIKDASAGALLMEQFQEELEKLKAFVARAKDRQKI